MEDFEPSNLAKNVPSLSELYKKRTNLKNLITKLDNNDLLNQLLTQLMVSDNELERLRKELLDRSEKKEETSESNEGSENSPPQEEASNPEVEPNKEG